jgi:CBS domain-containing protein
MSPRAIVEDIVRDAPVLREVTPVGDATRALLDSGLPAVPVVDERDRYAGIFGEREFIQAVFPGYLESLNYVGFVPRSIEEVLEKRRSCAVEAVGRHLNRERIAVPADVADIQLAETFIHHRVLIVPVVDDGRVIGVVLRSTFFRALAERFLAR